MPLHLVADNATHKHPAVTTWLAGNPWVTLHFTPTSGSWLHLVEIFFGIITWQVIRRGTFRSVADLKTAIATFIDGWNDRCQPFTWTKPADELLDHCRPGKRTSFTRDQPLPTQPVLRGHEPYLGSSSGVACPCPPLEENRYCADVRNPPS